MLKDNREIDHRTVKLLNHNLEKVFFVQLNGEVAQQLIAEANGRGWWSLLYKDIYSHEALLRQDLPEEFMESIRRSFSIRLNPDPLYLEWLEIVHKEGRLVPSTWAIGVQGTVEEIVT
jgi:hypothetical protein